MSGCFVLWFCRCYGGFSSEVGLMGSEVNLETGKGLLSGGMC